MSVCLAEIDCGAAQARAELLFLAKLLIKLGDGIDPIPNGALALGCSDILHPPAGRAGDFIRLDKVSIEAVEFLAALRVRAMKAVEHLIEIAAGHRAGLPCAEESHAASAGESSQ